MLVTLYTLFQVSSCPHIAHFTILMHDTMLRHVVFQCICCRATSSCGSVRYAQWRKTPSGLLPLVRLACVVSCYYVGQSGSLTFYRTGVMLSYPTTKVSDSTTDKELCHDNEGTLLWDLLGSCCFGCRDWHGVMSWSL